MIEQSLLNYHKSISHELDVLQDRIRNLIGESHWLTDGKHKENILADIFSRHIGEDIGVKSGFVCYESGNSKEIDIILTDTKRPVLYKHGDTVIATPSSVKGIIEVKTMFTDSTKLKKSLRNICSNIKKTREVKPDALCGLFIYESTPFILRHIMNAIQEVVEEDIEKVINFISIGKHHFIRFWKMNPLNSSEEVNRWHLYKIDELSRSYFISNFVYEICQPHDSRVESLWFPLVEGSGKEDSIDTSINLIIDN